MELPRTKQCAKCPWKVSTNPLEIPDGYCKIKHANLSDTIAKEGELNLGPLRVMACHHSNGNDKMMCIGWLYNQLGVGNNIGLRLRILMGKYTNIGDMEVYGEQHERFQDTFPKN